MLSEEFARRIAAGEGLRVATELAVELASLDGVDALHLFPLGAETAMREITIAYRQACGAPALRC